ncbi:unnamed protein product [Allacma fusca]|uniref:BEN domain-containing protein n=1 Tax=Allacma fusca TaxID=39272 RepID=A0A8J2J6L9_9HEXA|nr:unnamed protein product [Allacma fusca]
MKRTSKGRKSYDGIILHKGSKKEMDTLCNSLAEQASECEGIEVITSKEAAKTQKISKKQSARIGKSEAITKLLSKRMIDASISNAVEGLNSINEVERENAQIAIVDGISISGDVPNAHINMHNELQRQEKILRLEAKVEKLKKGKQKLREQKNLNESLQRKLEVSSSSTKKVELVIGSGVFLRASKIAYAKLGSKTPSILARKLFRYIFTPEKMQGHSISGRKCNANKGVPALPSVDATKRDAVNSR